MQSRLLVQLGKIKETMGKDSKYLYSTWLEHDGINISETSQTWNVKLSMIIPS